jgi:hypothetical protein
VSGGKKKFKQGELVRHRTVRGVVSPSDDQWQEATVSFCGDEKVFVRYEWDDDGLMILEEEAWKIRDTELVPVYPEAWINVYADLHTDAHMFRNTADMEATADRVALIHLRGDGAVTLEPCGVSGDVRGAA